MTHLDETGQQTAGLVAKGIVRRMAGYGFRGLTWSLTQSFETVTLEMRYEEFDMHADGTKTTRSADLRDDVLVRYIPAELAEGAGWWVAYAAVERVTENVAAQARAKADAAAYR